MKPQCLILKAAETVVPSYIESTLDAEILTDYAEFIKKTEEETVCDWIFIDAKHVDAAKAWDSTKESSRIFLHLPQEESYAEGRDANLLMLMNKIEADNETKKINDFYFEIDNLLKSNSNEKDFHKALKPALTQIGKYFDVGRLSVQLIFDDKKEVVSAIEIVDGSTEYQSVDKIIGHKSEMKEGVSGEALSSGNVVFCDLDKAVRNGGRIYADCRYITIPLLNREELIGVLSATSFPNEVKNLNLVKSRLSMLVSHFGPTIAIVQNEKRLARLNDKLVGHQKAKDFLTSALKHDFINSIEGSIKVLANLMLESIHNASKVNDWEKENLAKSISAMEEAIKDIEDSAKLSSSQQLKVKNGMLGLIQKKGKWNELAQAHEGSKIITKRIIFFLDQLVTLIREIGVLHEPNLKKIIFAEFQEEYRLHYGKNYEKQASKSGITLKWNLRSEVIIRFDLNHLTRIWNNLISNAIKYSLDGGTVSIESRLVGNMLEIAISDDGIGVPKEDLANVFKSGFRSKNAEEKGIPGTGTGLGYVNYILGICGGTILVESPGRAGASSTFAIQLPVWVKGSKETINRVGRILVLGRNETIDDIVEKFLGLSGRTVEKFEIVTNDDDEVDGIAEKMADFGTLLYKGDTKDKAAVSQLAKKVKAVVICTSNQDEGGVIIASEKELHEIADDPFQMNLVPDIVLTELNEL